VDLQAVHSRARQVVRLAGRIPAAIRRPAALQAGCMEGGLRRAAREGDRSPVAPREDHSQAAPPADRILVERPVGRQVGVPSHHRVVGLREAARRAGHSRHLQVVPSHHQVRRDHREDRQADSLLHQTR
jgi:hypothetical protein